MTQLKELLDRIDSLEKQLNAKGKGNPHHDKSGRFTSKERAVAPGQYANIDELGKDLKPGEDKQVGILDIKKAEDGTITAVANFGPKTTDEQIKSLGERASRVVDEINRLQSSPTLGKGSGYSYRGFFNVDSKDTDRGGYIDITKTVHHEGVDKVVNLGASGKNKGFIYGPYTNTIVAYNRTGNSFGGEFASIRKFNDGLRLVMNSGRIEPSEVSTLKNIIKDAEETLAKLK